jgi:hypothetical protein
MMFIFDFQHLTLNPSSLATATWALVLLDVLSFGRCNLDAFSMEPFLTHITANPELISSIAFTTCSTSSTLFIVFFFLFPTLIVFLGWCRYLYSLSLGLRLPGLLKGHIQTAKEIVIRTVMRKE